MIARGVGGRRFSFVGFAAAQVTMDLESGYFLLRHEWPFHRFVHTFIGATLACGLAMLVCRQVARWWTGRPVPASVLVRLARRDLESLLSPSAVLATTILAVLGHIVPDGIMHADVRPFAPFTDDNPLHRLISVSALHWTLIGMGTLGAALVAWRERESR